MIGAGVDYGVRRVAVSIPSKSVFEEINLSGSDDPIADIEVLSDWVFDIFRTTRPSLVAVERPIQGISRNVRVGLAMGMVAGALSTTIRKTGADVILVEPSTWKKAVVGRGNADKAAVKDWLSQVHPAFSAFCGSSQDLVDATCLGLHADQVLAGRRSL